VVSAFGIARSTTPSQAAMATLMLMLIQTISQSPSLRSSWGALRGATKTHKQVGVRELYSTVARSMAGPSFRGLR
jgi:hypothetical protein